MLEWTRDGKSVGGEEGEMDINENEDKTHTEETEDSLASCRPMLHILSLCLFVCLSVSICPFPRASPIAHLISAPARAFSHHDSIISNQYENDRKRGRVRRKAARKSEGWDAERVTSAFPSCANGCAHGKCMHTYSHGHARTQTSVMRV